MVNSFQKKPSDEAEVVRGLDPPPGVGDVKQ
jgi:hypothetical protein